MRTIGVVTVARSDYGIYRPILRRIEGDPDLSLHLIVGGAHLSREFGFTVRMIEQDRVPIGERITMLLSSDSPEGIAKSIGMGVMSFAQAYGRYRPDVLLTLGDRVEMLAAVVAALPFTIPVGHIHGGESTEGVIDEAIRHSITKMSHVHFVSTQHYRSRVIQLGEEPWRVIVSGAPSLDNLATLEFLGRTELEKLLSISLDEAPLLVTCHPVTLELDETSAQMRELLAALEAAGRPVVFTYPGADTEHGIIIHSIEEYVRTHSDARLIKSLGTRAYFSLMRHAAAMVGNSSSGIIEAASFELPVVNVGNRQRGRVHSRNVVTVPCDAKAILAAIRNVTSPSFRASLSVMANPYGDGHAAERIVDVLRTIPLDRPLIEKQFHELPVAGA